MTGRWGRSLRIGFGVAIWAGLVAAIVTGWDRVRDPVTGSIPLVVAATPLVVVGLLCSARGWATLQPAELAPRAFRAFLAAQPAKYLPGGGAFQLVGQIGMTSSTRADRPRAGVAFVVHAFIQVSASLAVALLILLPPPETWPWTGIVVASAATITAFGLRRSLLETGLRMGRRFLHRFDLTGAIPPTSTLWKAWGWTVIPMVLSGLAFATLAGRWSSPGTALATVGAFAAAWVVGFMVFPLPSGLGLRELVLVGLLPAIPPSQVIAASVLHRFATLLAELLVLALISRQAFAASRKHDRS